LTRLAEAAFADRENRIDVYEIEETPDGLRLLRTFLSPRARP